MCFSRPGGQKESEPDEERRGATVTQEHWEKLGGPRRTLQGTGPLNLYGLVLFTESLNNCPNRFQHVAYSSGPSRPWTT